jgi:hypothetical protein
MRFFLLVLGSIIFLSCKSSHKLTGTDYTDLGSGEALISNEYFPQEIADSLGWGDLTSSELKVNEEFRFTLISSHKPYHLYRLKKGRKVEGESILFWPRIRTSSFTSVHENMLQYLEGKCSDVHQTRNYEYCEPLFRTEPDWGKLYSTLEDREIWTIPDQPSGLSATPDSIRWVMNTQVRLGDYYRTYTHINPENYTGIDYKINILAITAQLQSVSNREEKAENFNTYSGVTNGKRSSFFKPCGETETWRFDGNLEELLSESGYPAELEQTGDSFFYVTVSGTVEDEWYANRGVTGYTKVIRPTEITNFVIVSSDKCPNSAP